MFVRWCALVVFLSILRAVFAVDDVALNDSQEIEPEEQHFVISSWDDLLPRWLLHAIIEPEALIAVEARYDNGALMFSGFVCEHDQQWGRWTAYRETGEVLWSGDYRDGEPVGKWSSRTRFMSAEYPAKFDDGWCLRSRGVGCIESTMCGFSLEHWRSREGP